MNSYCIYGVKRVKYGKFFYDVIFDVIFGE
jgi:hypothetical protein